MRCLSHIFADTRVTMLSGFNSGVGTGVASDGTAVVINSVAMTLQKLSRQRFRPRTMTSSFRSAHGVSGWAANTPSGWIAGGTVSH